MAWGSPAFCVAFEFCVAEWCSVNCMSIIEVHKATSEHGMGQPGVSGSVVLRS
jgi:hypothetical protein